MKKILAILLISFLVISPVYALSSPTDERFEGWMTFYYMKKDPSTTEAFLKWLQTNQVIERKPAAIAPITAFLSIVFTENTQQLPAWLHATAYTGKALESIQKALWLSGNTDKMKEVSTDIPAYASKPPPVLAELTVSSATDLDLVWGAFFASGNPMFVKKVIDTLGAQDPILAAAAEWSLESNMKTHPLVSTIATQSASTVQGETKLKLAEILARRTR